MPEYPKITVKERRRIYKYAEGANPETDEPYEVVEEWGYLKDAEAAEYLKKVGIDPPDIIAKGQERGQGVSGLRRRNIGGAE